MGSVPTHWEILSLGQVGTLTKGNGGNKEDELPTGMPCVRYGDLYTTHKYFIENARSFISPEVADQYTKIKFGDVLFAASGETADEIGKSAVNLLRGPAYCGGDVILFRPHGHLIPRYTGYMMDCEPIVHQKATMGRGFTVYHVYGKQLKYLRIPIPPLEEQAAIVRFLDHADEQTQRYIAGKERLIALLEEERQALVHQAVTRGLDPNVQLKPSGVEWLGDVPEHWGIRRLKTICYMKSGEGITATSIETEGEYPVYGGNGLRGYTFEFTHNGDYVLIGRQGALSGNIHVAREKFWASEHAVVATLSPNHVLEWFSALLEVMNLNQYSIAAAQPGLAVDRVMNLWAPIPPREEQAHIATRMGRQTERIDNIVNNAHRQIDFMNEYRTRLIADVATGQLDVREAAAQLLDDFSEEEPKDEYGLITDNMDHDSYDASQPPEEEPVTERETIL